MSRRELRAAEEGFHRLLRAKRFRAGWIAENAPDLFARAEMEYVERLAGGRPAENPVGWLIVCAWQRTKNLLDTQRRRPYSEPIEDAIGLADPATPTPEEAVIDRDRIERIRQAMSFLSEAERRLLELTYSDGMSIREAGRQQGWGKSSADRHHAAALERLRALLGDQRELLAGELSLAAWLARAKAHGVRLHVAPGFLGALGEAAQKAAGWLGNCATETWRRLSPFTEPGGAAALSAPARATGACVAALACIATGVVGPGLGGVDVIDHAASQAKPAAARQVPKPPGAADAAAPGAEAPPAPEATGAGESPASRGQEPSSPPAHRKVAKRAKLTSQPAEAQRHEDRSASEQTVTEFGLEGGSQASTAATAPEAAPQVSSSTATGSSSSGSSAPSSAKGSGSAAASEFGM